MGGDECDDGRVARIWRLECEHWFATNARYGCLDDLHVGQQRLEMVVVREKNDIQAFGELVEQLCTSDISNVITEIGPGWNPHVPLLFVH